MNEFSNSRLTSSGSFLNYQTYSSTGCFAPTSMLPIEYNLIQDGFNALIGAWPGTETDEEIEDILNDVE